MTSTRIVDIVVSLIALLVLLPLLLVISILVLIFLGRPIIFSQLRPGYKGKIFKMYKFRSMTAKKDNKGHLLSDAKRLTTFGRFLRSSSLDELPELWNVLKGDMSLVGPRPLLIRYLPLYNKKQSRRHDVKPGITGWAQVNGRNSLTWEERFDLDVWYVDNKSLLLDIKILGKTVIQVFKREGISADGEATMYEFLGSYDK